MKTFQKIISLAIATLMLASTLVSCNQNSPDSTTPEVTTPEVTTPEETTPEETPAEPEVVVGLDALLAGEKVNFDLSAGKDLEINPWTYAMSIYNEWVEHVAQADAKRTDDAFYTEELESEYTHHISMSVGSYAGITTRYDSNAEVGPDGKTYIDKTVYFDEPTYVDSNGKVKTNPNYSTHVEMYGTDNIRTLDTIHGYTYSADDSALIDAYGGYTGWGQIGKKTGFFHTEFIDGRWWLIDPLGYPFFHTGVNTISIDGTYTINKKKYSSPEDWAEKITNRFWELGFNSVGGWSKIADLINADRPLSQTMITATMRNYAQSIGVLTYASDGSQFTKGIMPVFDPGFVEFAKEDIQKDLAPYIDNPYVYGWMSDNELEYNEDMLYNCISLDPAKTETVYSYAMGWTFMYMQTGNLSVARKDISQELQETFMGLVYDRYLSVVEPIFRETDPNHIFLGTRLLKTCVSNENVLKVVGVHVDIVCANIYKETSVFSDVIQSIQNIAGKPFLITEFGIAAMDAATTETQTTNAGSSVFTVKTQTDKGLMVQNYALKLLECKYSVGFDFFQYRDGRSNSALFTNSTHTKAEEQEYTEFTELFGMVNNAKYSLIEFFDERNG